MGLFINNGEEPGITRGVLIMDDNEDVAALFAETLAKKLPHVAVFTCHTSTNCKALCNLLFFHVIVCDILLPKDDIDGDMVVKHIRDCISPVPFIITMTSGNRETIERAFQCKPDEFFDKCNEQGKTNLELLVLRAQKGLNIAQFKLCQLQERHGISDWTLEAIRAASKKKRSNFSKEAKYTPTQVAKSLMLYAALADKRVYPELDLETISLNAGFGSKRSFINMLNKLKAIIKLPELFLG